MVQTEDQFAYIHHALLEHIKSGDTEIEAHELRDYIRRKTEVDTVTGMYIRVKYCTASNAILVDIFSLDIQTLNARITIQMSLSKTSLLIIFGKLSVVVASRSLKKIVLLQDFALV